MWEKLLLFILILDTLLFNYVEGAPRMTNTQSYFPFF